MENLAETHYPIHDLLRRRWSPRAFSSQPIEDDKLLSLFEAARWSPSSGNSQPWAFVIARRDDQDSHRRLVETLTGRNPLWAEHAPTLVLAAAKVPAQPGVTSRYAYYDLGQAVAQLAVQASALGLFVRQMGGFDARRAAELFELPDDYEPVTVIAVGYRGEAEALPEDMRVRETAPRTRRPLAEFVYEGGWHRPLRQFCLEKMAA